MRFESLYLDPRILKAIEDMGYEKCMPVQEQTLPESLKGRDVSVQAQTGTGKTAVFLVTALQRMALSRDPGKRTRVLILVPTRELAVQVEQQAEMLCKHLPYNAVSVYGGVGYDRQERELRAGVEIIVATPGRLIDFIKSSTVNLSGLNYFIIDEADRMFDMGFMPDVRYILKKIPATNKRQTMIFSATLDLRVRRLASTYMRDPIEVEIEPEQITVENVKQLVYHVSRQEKIQVLLSILGDENIGKAIIFTNMKRTAEEVGFKLDGNGIEAEVLTGDVAQSKRLRIIEKIKAGKLKILVATDVAARGLHIDGVTHVINFDVPMDSASYVHRIGRTARAGEHGVAYTIACENLVEFLPPIERYIEHKIEVGHIDFDLPEDKAGSFRRSRFAASGTRDARSTRPAPGARGGRSAPPRKPGKSKPDSRWAKSKPAKPKSATGSSAPPKLKSGKPKSKPRKRMGENERMAYYREKYGESFEKKKSTSSKSKSGGGEKPKASPKKAKKGFFGKLIGNLKKKK